MYQYDMFFLGEGTPSPGYSRFHAVWQGGYHVVGVLMEEAAILLDSIYFFEELSF